MQTSSITILSSLRMGSITTKQPIGDRMKIHHLMDYKATSVNLITTNNFNNNSISKSR